MLALLLLIGMWSFYSYYIYNRSGVIISYKDKEIGETRDAYVQLMTDFVTLNKNITEVMSSIEQKNAKAEVENYKRQASIVEERIKQITEEKRMAFFRCSFRKNFFERSPVAKRYCRFRT